MHPIIVLFSTRCALLRLLDNQKEGVQEKATNGKSSYRPARKKHNKARSRYCHSNGKLLSILYDLPGV